MSGVYYTKEGEEVIVSGAGRVFGEGYTLNVISPKNNSQYQTAKSQAEVEGMVYGGVWSKTRTPEFDKAEEVLKTAFGVYQQGRASGVIGEGTTFTPKKEGGIEVEKIKDYDKAAGLGWSKIKTVGRLPIVLVAIAIGVLGYFLFGNIRRE